ncbi:MarR family transcriptional regulator [Micromonospora sp. NPDC048909]|uniref:MarR family winged helix-turn-helix transcriptional regulator n=1 Tax=Micromonospora sp. NPDC048909 TaxID=3155643 RepID=UPI00340E4D1B
MSDRERWTAALDRVLELVVVLGDDMSRGLARDGLTESRATLLWTLRRTGPVPQRELAEALGVSARTITGLVDGLVASGFVTREPHPTDRRAFLVTFTPHGLSTVVGLEQGQREFAELLFGQMPAERLDAFVAGLDEILCRLREQGLSPELREEDR